MIFHRGIGGGGGGGGGTQVQINNPVFLWGPGWPDCVRRKKGDHQQVGFFLGREFYCVACVLILVTFGDWTLSPGPFMGGKLGGQGGLGYEN